MVAYVKDWPTLHNLQTRAVPWVSPLLLLDITSKPLADALRNRRTVNLSRRHDAPRTRELPDCARD